MKTSPVRFAALSLFAFAVLAPVAQAQFNSGSTGAYGAMNILNSTVLDLPADGIFHCTTVNVAAGATLSFNPNVLNTPVYILATGNVTIAGTVHVDGKPPTGQLPGAGGPGGFRGGYAATANLAGSHGLGPGGAAYNGGSATFYGNYGNAACIPLVGGSGGGGYATVAGGGGGGGALLIASNTQISVASTGIVGSRVASFTGYEGSSGAIRLVSPIITGTGAVTVNGSGRIRIDTEDRLSWRTLNYANVPGFSYGSRMVVFPGPVPRIDITNAAGTAIAEGEAAPVFVQLPAGSATAQTIQVKVSNMTGVIDVIVAVVPEFGARVLVTTAVDMGAGASPVTINVPVTIPVNLRCAIEAYKK